MGSVEPKDAAGPPIAPSSFPQAAAWYLRRVDQPVVGVIMGSESDLATMEAAAGVLREFGVGIEVHIVSAHRTPERMVDYAKSAASRGLKVVVAGAGGAAHLPGMVASLTDLPVIGVPVESKALHGLDSLLSIVQMPAGVPVATVAIGNARNAGLLAIRILALGDSSLAAKLAAFRESQVEKVLQDDLRVSP
ncbi:MAG: 5-(carboxyamino)imidazole ribonucleotide mutase [Fimbriimonadaceae bacterium]|nr:5-(carboxyamino)imidazole ribonucleotide mutase [Fimbriimonadaceae bacterium]QYK57560.1 MAG: 5-(carboxyamino)imidazole ribonucleotide mutase [Fimbriimonadaceae bacterium]